MCAIKKGDVGTLGFLDLFAVKVIYFLRKRWFLAPFWSTGGGRVRRTGKAPNACIVLYGCQDPRSVPYLLAGMHWLVGRTPSKGLRGQTSLEYLYKCGPFGWCVCVCVYCCVAVFFLFGISFC